METKSTNVVFNNNEYVYENKEIKVSYNLSKDQGYKMDFWVYNKTDKSITIDMNRSHYIINDESFDYYTLQENTISKTATSVGGNTYYGYTGLYTQNSAKSFSRSTTYKMKPTIEIPPQSKIQIRAIVVGKYIGKCLISRPSFSNNMPSVNFEEKNTPLKFRNYLTYYTEQNEKLSFVVDNVFWVDKVTNMKKNTFTGKGTYGMDCEYEKKVKQFPMPYQTPKNLYLLVIPK